MSILSSVIGLVQGNRAASAVQTANHDAMMGVLNRETDVNRNLPAAGANAANVVNNATLSGNQTIQQGLREGIGLQQPYVDAGRVGVEGLSKPAPTFSWDPNANVNDPAFQFRLKQGEEAIQNNNAKTGLASSGNVLKDLMSFGVGTSAQYENDDFGRALSTFKTNEDSSMRRFEDLAGLGQHAADASGNLYKDAYGKMAQNDINAGMFEGASGIDIAKFLAEYGARAGQVAGNYRIGQGNATAARDLNTGNQVSVGLGDLATLLFGGGTFDAGSNILFGSKRGG